MIIYRRKKGATLTLVAAVTIVIVLIAIGAYFIIKLLGGGRELANANDSGTLNEAKYAMVDPKRDAADFPNKDVASNFRLLGVDKKYLTLGTYNKLVAQALIVALNARDNGTSDSQARAKLVWVALNDVGKWLRTTLEDKKTLATYFDNASHENSLRMLGNNAENISSYKIAYMRRGSSTNILLGDILKTFKTPPNLPTNRISGLGKPTFNYVAGYTPIAIPLQTMNYNLVFDGLPVNPQDRPHLVASGDFENNVVDDIAVGKGTPSYPEKATPPNAFQVRGGSVESRSSLLVQALSCAIVSSMNQDAPLRMEYGFIEIRNKASAAMPSGAPSTKDKDIFCHELFKPGIYTNGKVFMTDKNAYEDWQNYGQNLANYNAEMALSPKPANWTEPSKPPVPPLDGVFKADGSPASLADAMSIKGNCTRCSYLNYSSNPTPVCMDLLPGFKIAYNRPGSLSGAAYDPQAGFTMQEQFKADLMAQRFAVQNCVSMNAPAGVSGVKWFDHNASYPAANSPDYQFSQVKSPYEYLQMIDQVSDCGVKSVFADIVRKCNQIVPGTDAEQIKNAMMKAKLPLGKSVFLFKSGDQIICNESRPEGYMGIDADGPLSQCGSSYSVTRQTIDMEQDGSMNYPFQEMPSGVQCKDNAVWMSSAGYDNLLGLLVFENSCSGGGKWCTPN